MPAGERSVPVFPSALKAGEFVGQYEIVERLGNGGMASVYKVRRGEGVYVLKILTAYFIDDAVVSDEQRANRLRADREFFAIRALDHPNILRGYGFERWPDVTRGWPYIVTEFVDGPDIYGWCEEERPSLRRICTVLAKIADALAHLHRAGLFHRDLKAPNILVRRESDDPVLIDLGIARHVNLEPVTLHCEVVGTNTHFAPEYAEHLDSRACALGEPFAWTAQVDLYALGYVAYELVTGRPPITPHRGDEAMLRAIRNDPVPDAREVNASIPGPLGVLVMQLLERDPSDRPEGAEAVQATLAEILAAGGAELDAEFNVPPPPAELELHRATRRRVPSYLPSWMAAEMGGGNRRGPTTATSAAREVDPDAIESPAIDVDAGGGSASSRSPTRERKVPAKASSGITSAIRKAEKRLALGPPRMGRSTRVLVVCGGAVACILIAVTAASGRSREPTKDSMLARLERQQSTGTRDGGLPRPSAATAHAMPIAVATAPGPAPLLASPEAPPSTSDARDIDAAIAARYGRPTVPPAGSSASSAAAPRQRDGGTRGVALAAVADDPLLHAEMLEPAVSTAVQGSSDAGARSLGIAMGTHIRAKLLSNLDSRTIGSGPVEAMLALPLVLHGGVALPARTMIYGRASEASGRFTIQFTQLRLPDDREIAFDGLALDRGDNKPGLAASARIAPAEGYREDGLGTKIARGTGNVLLSTVAGGVAQDVARGAGSSIVNNRSGESVAGAGSGAILLDSGVFFDVFVTRAF